MDDCEVCKVRQLIECGANVSRRELSEPPIPTQRHPRESPNFRNRASIASLLGADIIDG